MESQGSPLTIDDLRVIAFRFAEQLQIQNRFNTTDEKAGYDWVQLFLKKNQKEYLTLEVKIAIAKKFPCSFVTLLDEITRIKDKEKDNCRFCGDIYYKTQLDEDWQQCVICLLWVHGNCTEFEDMCLNCGNKKKMEIKDAKGKEKGQKRPAV
ncbi:hypothetical protein JTB14_022728 [Gonioctena quinquepunctata]|nr:hypothetical protein JTB14_022728 [Gonioctena quinquepunctata]